jgi:hypothetical protein
VIAHLIQGEQLQLKANRYNNVWEIYTTKNQLIGALSRRANEELSKKELKPG